MWTLYDKLIASVDDAERVACVRQGEGWTAVATDSGLCGVCATQQGRRGAG